MPTTLQRPRRGIAIAFERVEATQPRMGTGACTQCDCPSFNASFGHSPEPGVTCINLNSAGGTCNHWFQEHGN